MGDIPTLDTRPSHADHVRRLMGAATRVRRYAQDLDNAAASRAVSPSEPQRLMNEISDLIRTIDEIEAHPETVAIKKLMGDQTGAVDLAAGRAKLVALQAECHALVFNPDGTDKVTKVELKNGVADQTRAQLQPADMASLRTALAKVLTEALD